MRSFNSIPLAPFALLLAISAVGCSASEDDGDSPPTILHAEFASPAVANEPTTLDASVEFTDPDGDINGYSLVLKILSDDEEGPRVAIEHGEGVTSGTVPFRAIVPATPKGNYVVNLRLYDKAGHTSNVFPMDLTVE